MSVTVRVPTTLRTLTAGASEVPVEGSTVGEVLEALERTHPGFKERLLDDDVRFLKGLDTPVPEGETLSIIPAVAGG